MTTMSTRREGGREVVVGGGVPSAQNSLQVLRKSAQNALQVRQHLAAERLSCTV